MAQQTFFEDKDDFVKHLHELINSGVAKEKIQVQLPYHVPEVEELLIPSPGKLSTFTFVGGLTGFMTGFAFTIYTVTSWPLITGGKPLISIPAFLIIAYILAILFGSLATFFGFLILTRLPKLRRMIPQSEELGNRFLITVEDQERP